MASQLTIVETFVGCGGSHIGFKNNGFVPIFVNDIWNDSMETLKKNNTELKEEQILLDDINNIVKRDLLSIYNMKKGDLSVLMGGVVCKGFSLAGVRNPYDTRNYLYLSQLKLAEIFHPKISIIENVPGMEKMKILKKKNIAPISKSISPLKSDENIEELCIQIDKSIDKLKKNRGQIIAINKKLNINSSDEKLQKQLKDLEIEKSRLTEERDQLNLVLEDYKYNVIDDIIARYNELGYRVEIKKLTCSHYGGYTNRQRLIIVAIRNDITKPWIWPQITNSDTDEALPNLFSVRDAFNLLDLNGVNCPSNDLDNVPMNHKQSTIEKFKLIGTTSSDTKNKSFSSRGTSNRLKFDKPAPTLVPGHSSFQIHPSEHRSITVREGAIITGFPKDYAFCGNHSSRCMQIGNAIPTHLSNAIAECVRKFLMD